MLDAYLIKRIINRNKKSHFDLPRSKDISTPLQPLRLPIMPDIVGDRPHQDQPVKPRPSIIELDM